jgi:hypothetical protein
MTITFATALNKSSFHALASGGRGSMDGEVGAKDTNLHAFISKYLDFSSPKTRLRSSSVPEPGSSYYR